jgi:thiamine-monophosphate kinase
LPMDKGKRPLRGVADRAESRLIRQIARAALGQQSVGRGRLRLGIGDDAALLSPKPGFETILTCDWFLEGTHFLSAKHPPDSVGWKCLARAVSDVAAMGGTPRYFLLSLALPASRRGRWFAEFLRGLRRASQALGCELVGGDTTGRPEILINVTVVGEVPNKHAVLRSGARPGDLIYVSGRLGEAEFGLRHVCAHKGRLSANDPHLKKHLYPEPRLALGSWLAEKDLATAMMDLSDGLSTDLPRLCTASSVGAQIEAPKIPVVQVPERRPERKHDHPLELALNGGDDYELLFTVSQRNAKLVPQSFQKLKLTLIGRITREKDLLLIGGDGRKQRLLPGGWDPFR